MKENRGVKVTVVGASGYAGEELVRLLLAHPHAELVEVSSRQYAGCAIADIFPRFSHQPKARALRFTDSQIDTLAAESEVAFLALPHGVAAEFARPLLASGCRVIDLSADFRTRDAAVYAEFYGSAHPAPELLGEAVYGLAEMRRAEIAEARLVACPGCYPTSILLPLLPLVREKLVRTSGIIADSLSGVSGAGRKIEAAYLFAECNESVRPYGVPKHRHLSEIEQELAAAAGEPVTIQFTPHLIPVTRGILSTIYLEPTEHATADRIRECLQNAFGREPFVRLLEGEALPDTKNVVGTNFIDLAWRHDPRTGRLIVMSAIDNVVKGTSGQAIQCLNIMCGYDETAGLL